MNDVTSEHIEQLAAKLRSAALDDREQQILETILHRAAAYEEPEVEGFMQLTPTDTSFKGTDEELQALLGGALGGRFGFNRIYEDRFGDG